MEDIDKKCEYNGIKFNDDNNDKCEDEYSNNLENIDISALSSEFLKCLITNKAVQKKKSHLYINFSASLANEAILRQIHRDDTRMEILVLAVAIIFLAISVLIWSFKSQKQILLPNVNNDSKEENDRITSKKEEIIEQVPSFDSSISSTTSSSQGRLLARRNRKSSFEEGKANGQMHFDFEINNKEILGIGSLGTTVYAGRFQMRDVAVKRLLKNYIQLAKSEIAILMKAEHANIIRYYLYEEDE